MKLFNLKNLRGFNKQGVLTSEFQRSYLTDHALTLFFTHTNQCYPLPGSESLLIGQEGKPADLPIRHRRGGCKLQNVFSFCKLAKPSVKWSVFMLLLATLQRCRVLNEAQGRLPQPAVWFSPPCKIFSTGEQQEEQKGCGHMLQCMCSPDKHKFYAFYLFFKILMREFLGVRRKVIHLNMINLFLRSLTLELPALQRPSKHCNGPSDHHM